MGCAQSYRPRYSFGVASKSFKIAFHATQDLTTYESCQIKVLINTPDSHTRLSPFIERNFVKSLMTTCYSDKVYSLQPLSIPSVLGLFVFHNIKEISLL